MKPVDPRLLRVTPALRGYLLRLGALAAASAALVIVQGTVLADVVVTGQQVAVGALTGTGGVVALLVLVAAARAAVVWLSERTAERTCPAVSAGLRQAMLGAVVDRTAGGVASVTDGNHRGGAAAGTGGDHRDRDGGAGALAVTAGAGLDGMDAYLTRFLPALVMVVVVPPFVLARIAGADLASAAVLAVVLPLVPVFMVLVGLATRNRTDRQLAVLSRLSGHFLDVVEGLPTLRIFNRARPQVAVIRRITDAYRGQTMAALRWAFLSSFVLELLATLSVALVAVSVGLRLVSGSLDLGAGLLVLLLAPEVYLPLRQVGAQYHATVSGLTAAAAALDVIDATPPSGRPSAALAAPPGHQGAG
ncbi:ABC transporter transmembrane domain-containing protein, partial [Frankia sp. CiP1_Cm_nod1]